jgi:hypothetical protein
LLFLMRSIESLRHCLIFRLPIDIICHRRSFWLTDDVTRTGIRKAGRRSSSTNPNITRAMFLWDTREKPVLGLPACVFHHNATLFDLIFPRVLSGEVLKEKKLVFSDTGFCLNCNLCHFLCALLGKGRFHITLGQCPNLR